MLFCGGHAYSFVASTMWTITVNHGITIATLSFAAVWVICFMLPMIEQYDYDFTGLLYCKWYIYMQYSLTL